MELKNFSILKKNRYKIFISFNIDTEIVLPVSHIIIGETQAPINYVNVKVYYDYPMFTRKLQ